MKQLLIIPNLFCTFNLKRYEIMIIDFNGNAIDTLDISEIPKVRQHPLYGCMGYIQYIIMKNGVKYSYERWCNLELTTLGGKVQSEKLNAIFQQERDKLVSIWASQFKQKVIPIFQIKPIEYLDIS